MSPKEALKLIAKSMRLRLIILLVFLIAGIVGHVQNQAKETVESCLEQGLCE